MAPEPDCFDTDIQWCLRLKSLEVELVDLLQSRMRHRAEREALQVSQSVR